MLMDPGMAFGTGEHETTSMCIELMQEYPVAGKDVIDVGCGSGILGITAVKLAAKGTAERTAELLRLEQLAEELQARSEEMRARTRSSKYFGKGRMLRAYPKLRHGEKHRSLDELRERLKYERRH